MATDRDGYLQMDDRRLLAECDVHCHRASGPGGQKRNKTSSAVRLRHRTTGLTVVATESRSQHENKARALRRLRMAVALHERCTVDDSVLEVLRGVDGVGLRVNVKHATYPLVVAGVLDVLAGCGCRVSDAADGVGVSTAKLVEFFRRDDKVWARVNAMRAEAGFEPLR